MVRTSRSEVVSFDVKFPPEHAENFEVSSEALPAVFRILCRGLQHAAGLLADIQMAYWRTATFHPEQKPGHHHLGEADRYLLRVVRLFDRLVTEHPVHARAEVAQWPTDDKFFFDKLKIYALMKLDLFSGHECTDGSSLCPRPAFGIEIIGESYCILYEPGGASFHRKTAAALKRRYLKGRANETQKTRTNVHNAKRLRPQ